jgi:hypothetical protein
MGESKDIAEGLQNSYSQRKRTIYNDVWFRPTSQCPSLGRMPEMLAYKRRKGAHVGRRVDSMNWLPSLRAALELGGCDVCYHSNQLALCLKMNLLNFGAN